MSLPHSDSLIPNGISPMWMESNTISWKKLRNLFIKITLGTVFNKKCQVHSDKKQLNEPGNSTFMGLHWRCLVKSVKHRRWGNYLFTAQGCLVECMAHINYIQQHLTNNPYTASFNRIKPCPVNPEKENTQSIRNIHGISKLFC